MLKSLKSRVERLESLSIGKRCGLLDLLASMKTGDEALMHGPVIDELSRFATGIEQGQ